MGFLFIHQYITYFMLYGIGLQCPKQSDRTENTNKYYHNISWKMHKKGFRFECTNVWCWRKHGLIDGHGWIIDMPTYIYFSSRVLHSRLVIVCIYLKREKDRISMLKDYYAPINLYFLCYIQMALLAQSC